MALDYSKMTFVCCDNYGNFALPETKSVFLESSGCVHVRDYFGGSQPDFDEWYGSLEAAALVRPFLRRYLRDQEAVADMAAMNVVDTDPHFFGRITVMQDTNPRDDHSSLADEIHDYF